MSAAAIEAARAFVRILADDSPVRRTLNGLKKHLETLGAGMRTVGTQALSVAAIGAAPLLAAAGQFANSGGELDDMAQITGMTGENLSRLGYAAKLSGTSLEAVGKGSLLLSKNLLAAEQGSAGVQEAFRRQGVTAEQLLAMSPEARFLKIADALAGIEDPGKRSATAMELFGKSGAELAPLLAQGSAGIAALMAESDALGNTMTNEQVSAAAQFGDSLDRLWTVSGALAVQLGAGLAPVLGWLVDLVVENGAAVVGWVRENGMLIAGVLIGIGVIGELGAALIAGGAALSALGAIVGVVLSPLGILIGVVTAVGIMGVQALGGVGEAASWLAEQFGPMADRAKESFSAISGALMAGDWQAAARVLWATLEMEWLKGTKAIREEWLIWKKAFLDTFFSALGEARKMWAEWQGWLSQKALSVMAFFDASIDVDAASAELDSMLRDRIENIDRQTAADSAARETAFENDLIGVAADLEAARAEWAAAVEQANTAAEKAANDPSAAEIASNRFSELLNELRAGDIATRVDAAAKQSGGAVDLRTVQGAGIVAGLMNRQTEISQQQLRALQRIENLSRRQVSLSSTRMARV